MKGIFMSIVSHTKRTFLTLLIIPLTVAAPILPKMQASFSFNASFDTIKSVASTIAGACLVGAGVGLATAGIYALCSQSDEQVLSEAQEIHRNLSNYYHDAIDMYQIDSYYAYDKEHRLKRIILQTKDHSSYFHNCCPTIHYQFIDYKLNVDTNVRSLANSYQAVNGRIAKIKNRLHTQYHNYAERNHLEQLVIELEEISYKQARLLDILRKIQSDVEILAEYRLEIREKRLEEKQRELEKEQKRERKKRKRELRELEQRLILERR